ncbi:MAG: type III secretion chaperone SycN [Desulfovibrio sp.]|nr:type III secretion chaperone SycN [Desulfovibrio sp.]
MQSAVEEFGRRLGMPSLTVGPEGLAALDISDVGRLTLEILSKSGQEELLVYLSRPVPAHDRDLAKRALAFCHFSTPRPFALWAGIYKDDLILLTRFSEREATGQVLENAALFLTDSLKVICERSK